MRWIRSLTANAWKEPIALAALALTMLSFIYEREFFQRWLRIEPEVIAYHLETSDGRCPMIAFEVINNGPDAAHDIRLSVLEDWITARGDESIGIYTFEGALIGANESTPMERRQTLDVVTEIVGKSRFIIPELQPGEYVQRLVLRDSVSDMDLARSKLAKDERHKNRPAIGHASYQDGKLEVERHGECIVRN